MANKLDSAVLRLVGAVLSVFQGTGQKAEDFLMHGIVTRQVLSRRERRRLLAKLGRNGWMKSG